jgi:hypothetical protein
MRPLILPVLVLLGFPLACTAPERSATLEASPLAEPAGPPQAATPAPGAPTRVALAVRETAGVARAGEVVRSGVPLPRSLGVHDPRSLTVLGPDGKPVPAEFHTLARWNAGKGDAAAPIQWVLVVFPATVAARGSATYTLVADGSAGPNPPPPTPLRLSRQGQQVVVETGAATFRLGGKPGDLFDEIVLPDGKKIVTGTGTGAGNGMTLRAAATGGGHSTVRDVRIESQGALSAVVVIDGAYDLPPVGGGQLGSRRRYVFTAGSPTVVVRHSVAWEGDLACTGCLKTKDGKPDGVLVEKVRDTLTLDLGAPKPATATVVGAFKEPALEAAVGAAGADGSDLAALRQTLRARRAAPLHFEMAAGGQRRAGKQADGGVLAASGPAGSVAVAISHMHRYEPQALRLLADGRLAVDLADGKAWLANHQGMFATLAVTALPGAARRADLDRLVWAPLNRPLRAWPDAAWFTASEAVDEVPAGKLPKDLAAYDELIPKVLKTTVAGVDAEGLAGLMTFGVYPRYWGQKGEPGEIDCKDDTTPGEAWDDTFWCATWTDYHNTVETSAIWAMRSGEVEWLDELAAPGALRTLHTQIMQCGPDDKWFYCGQAPTGYNAYRADFNSSHAYFENLFLYYWLTGDSTVVDLVRRGGDNMRRLFCPSRGSTVATPHGPDGPACAATQAPSSDASTFTGRAPSQWIAAFRFLGLASDDASFLEDYRSGLARAVTQQYAELEQGGKRYGFLGEKTFTGAGGVYEAGPAWTIGFYDAENLYRLQRDTGDAPIGEPPLPPSRILAALARTVAVLGPGAEKGKAVNPDAPWPRVLAVTWTGPRIGGTFTTVEPKDRELYNPEKFGTVALLTRGGRQSADPELIRAGDEMIRSILRRNHEDVLPLCKIQGQTLTRLHAAVALAASAPR